MSSGDTADSSKQLAAPEIRSAFDTLTDLQDHDVCSVVENFINTTQPLISENSQNKDYVIKRLVLGVTSTRKASRLPFGTALWTFLNTEEGSEVSTEQIFELLSKTELKKLIRLNSFEETEQNQLAGCLTVCLVLAKVKKIVNLEVLLTLHQKFINPKLELKDSFRFVYDSLLMESLEIIAKQDYKLNFWPSFSVWMQNLKQEMSSSLAIETFLLLRRFPKLLGLIKVSSGDINMIESLDHFSLDNFISFNIGKMPFLHPCMTSFLRTFEIGSKMFGKLWKSLLERNEANASRLVWHVVEKSCTCGISQEQLQIILTSDFVQLLNNLNPKSSDADDSCKRVQEWIGRLAQNKMPFLRYMLENCVKCPKFLCSPIFQNSLAQADVKDQRSFFRHVEKQVFSSTKVSEVDILVSFVSKFSSSLEKSDDEASLKLRTLIDQILIRVSFTKVSNNQKSIAGKTADVLFHAIRSRLLSSVGDFAQEIFNFVSSDSKSAPVAAELISSSDSSESFPYIKQIVAVIVLDVCIHIEIEAEYAAYLKSLLQDIRKIPQWLGKNAKEETCRKKKEADVIEIEKVVFALIKLMNIPNKFYYNLANACFKSICEENLKNLDTNLIERLLSLHNELISSRENDQKSEEDDEDDEMSSEDEEESSRSESEPVSETEGEAPWEKEYFAQEEDEQIKLDEALNDEQVAQLEKFDQLWENQMKNKKAVVSFSVSNADSVSNFLHLLDCLLKDSCHEAILKRCFVFAIDSLTKSLTEDELGILFEMSSKILNLGDKKFVETLNAMSSEESGEIICKLLSALFSVSVFLKDKMYLTACKIVSTLLPNCREDTKKLVFDTFRTDYFLPWVNEGKCLNMSHFLNELFKLEPSLFWMFLRNGSGNGKNCALVDNSAAIKRITSVLTPRKFAMKRSTKKVKFFLNLCRLFLDAASSNVSLVQKQNCIHTVHLVSKSLNLKSSTEMLQSSSEMLETLKTKVLHTLKCFKSVDINQTYLNHLRNLAADFDIDVNIDQHLAYLRKRKNTDSEKRKDKSSIELKNDETSYLRNDSEEIQVPLLDMESSGPRKKRKNYDEVTVSNDLDLESKMNVKKKKKKFEDAAETEQVEPDRISCSKRKKKKLALVEIAS